MLFRAVRQFSIIQYWREECQVQSTSVIVILFFIDESKVNKSIVSITTTTADQKHDWRGPMIAYGKVGQGTDQNICRNFDMNEFRHIADYFFSYNINFTSVFQQSLDIKIKNVKINCIGDQKMFSKSHFEVIEIFSTDFIFCKHDISDTAKRVDFFIFTRRCFSNPRLANHSDSKLFDFINENATFLHLCCDSKAGFDRHFEKMGWGWTSMQWQKNVGSTLVVRQNKKPLLPLHVKALCKYCRYEIRPLFGHSQGEYASEKSMKKDAVLVMICRPTFVIYWYKLLDEKQKAGEDTNALYPYDDVELSWKHEFVSTYETWADRMQTLLWDTYSPILHSALGDRFPVTVTLWFTNRLKQGHEHLRYKSRVSSIPGLNYRGFCLDRACRKALQRLKTSLLKKGGQIFLERFFKEFVKKYLNSTAREVPLESILGGEDILRRRRRLEGFRNNNTHTITILFVPIRIWI